MNSHPIAKRPNGDTAASFAGPAAELLESLRLNREGAAQLRNLLVAFSEAWADVEPSERDKCALALGWLARAWSERDTATQFLAYFTALEVVLNGRRVDAQETEIAARMRSIIEKHSPEGDESLVNYFNSLVRNTGPSLADRFALLASESGVPDYPRDVEAFKKFARIRNGLVHRGDLRVRLDVDISEEDRQGIGDLAERYVCTLVFNDMRVYQSRWRSSGSGALASR
jgi:hypothetical protein